MYTSTFEGLAMSYLSGSAYEPFREPVPVPNDTMWANHSEWERQQMDAYDASLVPNGTGA